MARRWLAAAAGMMLMAAAAPAAAQDTYVSASLTGDVVRFDGSDAAGAADLSPAGEALGFALRVGTRIGSAWGVEAEFSRAAEIERESGRAPLPAGIRPNDPVVWSFRDGGITGPGIDPRVFPPLAYRARVAYQDTTLSAGAWVRQDFTARFALVYTGGIAFHRTRREAELTLDPLGIFPELTGLGLLPSRTVNGLTTYSTRPFIGIEGRLQMTEHLELVPGVRLHGLDGGLLVRPAVGIGWVF